MTKERDGVATQGRVIPKDLSIRDPVKAPKRHLTTLDETE
jgi:hypothetical protein